MTMYLIYVATGDFYEQYELRSVMKNLSTAHELAKSLKIELSKDGDMDGYGDELVFIREVISDKEIFSVAWNDIPEEWFV